MLRWVLALVLWPAVALAEPVELSLDQAVGVLSGLISLSTGKEVVVKEGERERAVKVQYKGWSFGIIMAMAKDINALKPPVMAFEQARLGALVDGKLPKEAEQEIVRSLSERTTYDLAKFKASELKPDANEIAPSVISMLQPILVAE